MNNLTQSGRVFKLKPCKQCIPSQEEPLIVSGRGYTEYNIWFCKICGRGIVKITKDFEDLYSVKKG